MNNMAIAERSLLHGSEVHFIARKMGWQRRAVVGELMYFWDETQERGVVDASREEIEIHLTVETEQEAQTFIDALIAVELITANGDGTLHLKGNGDHVCRLDEIRSARSKGGKKRSSLAGRSGGRFTSSAPADNQSEIASLRLDPSAENSPAQLVELVEIKGPTTSSHQLVTSSAPADSSSAPAPTSSASASDLKILGACVFNTISSGAANEALPSDARAKILELEKQWLDKMHSRGSTLTRISPAEWQQMSLLCDMSDDPKLILARYLETPGDEPRRFYEAQGWPIRLLVQDIAKLSKPTPSAGGRAPVPNAKDSERKLKERQRQCQEAAENTQQAEAAMKEIWETLDSKQVLA